MVNNRLRPFSGYERPNDPMGKQLVANAFPSQIDRDVALVGEMARDPADPLLPPPNQMTSEGVIVEGLTQDIH